MTLTHTPHILYIWHIVINMGQHAHLVGSPLEPSWVQCIVDWSVGRGECRDTLIPGYDNWLLGNLSQGARADGKG